MSLPDIASKLERVSSTVSIAGRSLLGLDTNPVSDDWSHITKVDPEGEKQLPLCFPLYLSQTSAISVGGSRDVTGPRTEEAFELLEYAPVPAFHEPSAAQHVTEKTRDHAEFLAIPEVLNGDSEALVGTLGQGIEYIQEDLGPSMIEEKLGFSLDGGVGKRLTAFGAGYMLQDAVFEAYIIMNPDSAAAREASVTEDDLLTPQEAKQRALAAEYHLESEVIYLEYSGTYGGEEATDILETISDSVTWSRLWYGGGLDNRNHAKEVLEAGADAVIVGDIFHEIANEEADLVEQARGEFDSIPSRDELADWIEQTVAINETSAARFLSTIVTVPDPQARALSYLAAGVEMALELDALAETADEPTTDEVAHMVQDETLSIEADFGDVLDGRDATAAAEAISEALLAERYELGEETIVSARQVGLSLS
ncbi:geranylgeranylglyceryl/heptaprenylglyceryl phosphate synthase [Halovenus rubra]|uniref:phosphoglycerol geranylgeranyltransferase n=2 Tax=Halovenus rubra TaxID=869890 RepID=A0ABD5X6C5_9EURY|nr:geranylgeranylglyceryl/heptaprenylglyceryl phosphate synthase [Halovenus rubra]